MKNILITAIGSMSVECVIRQLRKQDVFIIGCDIYPAEWHFESSLCDVCYQVPYARDEEHYIDFLLNLCKLYSVQFLIPSTDLEIDILRKYRERFFEKKVVLCMQSDEILSIVRNKFLLYKTYENDINVLMPKTILPSGVSE